MVVFAGPYHIAPLPRWQSPEFSDERVEVFRKAFGQNHWPEHASNYYCLLAGGGGGVHSYNHFPGMTPVRLAAGSRANREYASLFERYVERFGERTRWCAAWETWRWDGKPREDVFPLFFNSSGNCVGLVEHHFLDKRLIPDQKPGIRIILPNVEDVKDRAEAILFLASEVLPYLRPEAFPNHWYNTYCPRGLAERESKLVARRRELEEELATEEELILKERSDMERFKPLLRLTRDPLKLLVAEVYRSVFGFEVVDLDTASTKGEPKGADLLLRWEDFDVLMEVKGSESASLRQEHLDRFAMQIERYEARCGPVQGRVLTFNAQAKLPPSARSAFAKELAAQAMSHGIALMSTVQLVDLVEDWRTGHCGKEDLRALLATPGEVSTP